MHIYKHKLIFVIYRNKNFIIMELMDKCIIAFHPPENTRHWTNCIMGSKKDADKKKSQNYSEMDTSIGYQKQKYIAWSY